MTYISNLTYVLGDNKNILSLKENHNSDLLELMSLRGLDCFSESTLSLKDLTTQVIDQFRTKVLNPKNIGYVIYVVDKLNSIDSSLPDQSEMLNQFLDQLGAYQAVPFFQTMLSCASLPMALKAANNLIKAGDTDEVAVIYTNKVMDGESRFPYPAISVLSDVALAFSITKENIYDGYEIQLCEQSNQSSLKDYKSDEEYASFLESQIAECSNLFTKSLKKIQSQKEDVKRVYFNNYMPHLVKMFADELSLDESQLSLNNITRFCHAYSADTFINFCDDAANLNTDETVILLPNSITSWGVIALKPQKKNG